MTDDHEGSIKIEYLDPPGTTEIILSCDRETYRLDRMLKIYHKAMTVAAVDGVDFRLREGLLRLHDHKGQLTVVWRAQAFCSNLHAYVSKAWEDCNETEIVHEDMSGRILSTLPKTSCTERGIQPSPGFQKFGDLLPGVLSAARERMEENRGE